MSDMAERIERVAKAIARNIPVDGSRWCVGHGDNFPHEYSAAEQRLVRSIARIAIETDSLTTLPHQEGA